MTAEPLLYALAGRGMTAQAATITTTSSNFTTFLVQLPRITTFSASAEVQVVLAAFPFIILGFIGAAFAAFQLSVFRINRSFVTLFIATASAFVAGVLELFNVLHCESRGASTMDRGLGVASSLALAVFIAFRFSYLYRRTQQPAYGETLINISGELPISEPPPKQRGGFCWTRAVLGSPGATIHSGSYQRWGIAGGIVRTSVYLTILLVGLLEAIWRIGFLRSVPAFRGVYVGSNALQIVLIIFFAGKLAHQARISKARPFRQNLVEVTPMFFALSLSLAVAISNEVGDLLGFSETPLGRFLTLLSIFIFTVELVCRDSRHPFRDSLSFEDDKSSHSIEKTVLPASQPKSESTGERALFKRQEEQRKVAFEPSKPRLSEGIVVRRSSHVPSWLSGHKRESTSSDKISLKHAAQTPPSSSPTGPKSTTLPSPSTSLAFPSYYLQSSESAVPVEGYNPRSDRPPSDLGEGQRITFTGGVVMPPIPDDHRSQVLRHQKSGSTVKPAKSLHSRAGSTYSVAPSIGAYDSRGLRLSSPHLDLAFSFANAQAFFASTAPVEPPADPVDPAILPSSKPGVSLDHVGVIEARPALFTNDSHTESDNSRRTIDSRISNAASHTSSVSLSHFPRPPNDGDANELAVASRAPTFSVVTDGAEFELLPPRPLFSEAREESLRRGTAYDVTSLIIGGCPLAMQQPVLRGVPESVTDQESLLSSPLPVSPGSSDVAVAEIRQATIHSRSNSGRRPSAETDMRSSMLTVRTRKDSQMRVEDVGRIIPPRSDPSQELKAPAPPFFGRPGGLPSNPRRPFMTSEASESSRQQSPAKDSPPSSVLSSESMRSTPATSHEGGTVFDDAERFERPRPAPLALKPSTKGSRVIAMADVPTTGSTAPPHAQRSRRSRNAKVRNIQVVREN